MRYGIDIGHNINNDTGALSLRYEDELNMEVGLKVIDKLIQLGNEVVYCTPSEAESLIDSLSKRVSTANANKVDIYVSIHSNAGGGRGTEVFAANEMGRKVALSVVKEIAALGYSNRGVKNGSWLYVIKNTVAPAILIECAFVDSQEDMERFNGELMANAIVKGLTGNLLDKSSLTITHKEQKQQTQIVTEPYDNEVLYLQQLLNRLKIKDYSGEELIEDGVKGPRTVSAVKNFQSLIGLVVDGIAGSYTRNALNSILEKPYLNMGSGKEVPVKYIQWRTGAYIDGIFGPVTKEAVMNFQEQRELHIDGKVGDEIWKILME
jgi:N-acetylmuramoyl-L-alanine amidase